MHGLISCHWGYLRFLRMLLAQTHFKMQKLVSLGPEVTDGTLSLKTLKVTTLYPLSCSLKSNRTESGGDTWKLCMKSTREGQIWVITHTFLLHCMCIYTEYIHICMYIYLRRSPVWFNVYHWQGITEQNHFSSMKSIVSNVKALWKYETL